jgi:predicted O-methyltransferase YrrM
MPPDIEMLAGNPYARYALPIEYPPSRDLQPRWGYARPPIAALHDWFRAETARYRPFLDEMARCVASLRAIPLEYRPELLPEPAWFGVPFAAFDTLALYTMVTLRNPRRYVEIGSGISTCFAAKAVRDHGLRTRIVSIDPEPRAAIDAVCDEVVRQGLEQCDLALFDELAAGDVVFFDGTHRCFMNSDVTVFMIDILPRLKPGVIVHIHDIDLPWDYSPGFANWYWSEQYVLAAYMIAGRERLDPLLPTAFVCRDEAFAERLARPFIDFGDAARNAAWRGGGSMWLTHKAAGAKARGASGPG